MCLAGLPGCGLFCRLHCQGNSSEQKCRTRWERRVQNVPKWGYLVDTQIDSNQRGVACLYRSPPTHLFRHNGFASPARSPANMYRVRPHFDGIRNDLILDLSVPLGAKTCQKDPSWPQSGARVLQNGPSWSKMRPKWTPK